MVITGDIPLEQRERTPLIDAVAWETLCRIRDHADAPAWTYACGDRLRSEDLPLVDGFARRLTSSWMPTERPSPALAEWLEERMARTAGARQRFAGHRLTGAWDGLPTTSRADLSADLAAFVPRDVELSRVVVHQTTGSTGHVLDVPRHPAAIAMNHLIAADQLARRGIVFSPRAGDTATVHLGSQATTVQFATVFSIWQGAGFAKVNLHRDRWTPAQAQRFLGDLQPLLLTGDPLAYAAAMEWDIRLRPVAVFSTALALSEGMAARMRAHFACPVIDTYATTETGPIAASAVDGDGWSIVAPDLLVEIVDEAGVLLPEGVMGDICVSGGRNPFLPLFRYRTGDQACWRRSGDGSLRLHDLQARAAVLFRHGDGSAVHPVDLGRIVRRYAVAQHTIHQDALGECRARLRPVPGALLPIAEIGEALSAVIGRRVAVVVEPTLGDDRPGGKVPPYVCDLLSGITARR